MDLTRHYPMRRLLVFWLFILSAIAFLDRTNISIAGSAIRDELKIDNLHLGWIFSAFLLGYAAFQVVGGWLACRFGPRRVLAAGVLWWGVFSALTTVANPRIGHALLLLILIRFSLGAGEAVVYPASNQFVAEWIPVAERGWANGWIFAGVGAGAGLSIPVLTWIISHHGWRASFWFCALLGLLAGLVWYALARDMPEQHPLVSPDELKLIQTTRSTEEVRASDPPFAVARHALQSQRSRADFQLLQLWLCCMDILQLVLHLHGPGTRPEPEGKFFLFNDSVSRDDRLLPGRRICE